MSRQKGAMDIDAAVPGKFDYFFGENSAVGSNHDEIGGVASEGGKKFR
jgi:hypothetical protein